MSIRINGAFGYDINNFRWLWVFSIVSFLCPINLWDSPERTEKYHLCSALSGTYLMDKYQTFSANFLAKNAYSGKYSLLVFSGKIRKYNETVERDRAYSAALKNWYGFSRVGALNLYSPINMPGPSPPC